MTLPIYTALDLARVTGICAGVPFRRPVLCEHWTLGEPGEYHGHYADRGLELSRLLKEHCLIWKPAKVFIEAPLELKQMGAGKGNQGKGNFSDLLQGNGLVFLTMVILRKIGTPFICYQRQTVLKHFTDQARFKIRDDGKRACVARARQLWQLSLTWDEADAAALWDYGCALEHQREYVHAAVASPVLMGHRPGQAKGRSARARYHHQAADLAGPTPPGAHGPRRSK